jgi:hypothetical protein
MSSEALAAVVEGALATLLWQLDRTRGYDWLMRLVTMLALALVLVACGFMRDQIGIGSANGCIRKNCRNPDARDYVQCQAACENTYRQ